MLGSNAVEPTEAERAMRLVARRSVVTLRAIGRGEAFTSVNVGLRRPGVGLPPEDLPQVLGRRATRNLRRGEPVMADDLEARQ